MDEDMTDWLISRENSIEFHSKYYSKEANKMFEDLGYEIDIGEDFGIIRYAKHINDIDYYIRFVLGEKKVNCNIIVDNEILPLDLGIKELRAVNAKVKELGWGN